MSSSHASATPVFYLPVDRQRIEQVVQAVADRLDGEWLLVGGSLVALWIDGRRTTEDVDLVPVRGSKDARLALFGLAADLGLPVEALNSAADFFVERIKGWTDEIEVLRRGKRGTVYRPSATLFLLLKARRLSEADLADCLALLEKALRESLPVDAARVLGEMASLPEPEDEGVRGRRKVLRERLTGFPAPG
jgi:hypothetical protein